MKTYKIRVGDAMSSGEIIQNRIIVNYKGSDLVPTTIMINATSDKGLSINVPIQNVFY